MKRFYLLLIGLLFVLALPGLVMAKDKSIWEKDKDTGEWVKYKKEEGERLKGSDLVEKRQSIQKEIDALVMIRDANLTDRQIGILIRLFRISRPKMIDGKFVGFMTTAQELINEKTEELNAVPKAVAEPIP